MKKFVAIIVCCQLLLLNGMAWAHMASEVHDPHETLHVHAGDNHNDQHDHHSGSAGESHDGSTHLHLCALALDTLSLANTIAPASTPATTTPVWRSCAHSPPVPPPNA